MTVSDALAAQGAILMFTAILCFVAIGFSSRFGELRSPRALVVLTWALAALAGLSGIASAWAGVVL